MNAAAYLAKSLALQAGPRDDGREPTDISAALRWTLRASIQAAIDYVEMTRVTQDTTGVPAVPGGYSRLFFF